ncbi:MAG: winged helix-turn-helix transcriptional regulator [Desulfobacterales bacterium]
MDSRDLCTLKILERVGNENTPSQRDLSGELNISLGLVNSFIKRLVTKGFVKIATLPKNRIKYILTPSGAAEKTRLTYKYIQHSYTFYKDARQKLRQLYVDLEDQGVTRIVFYGAGDLAEIAYISLQETLIQFAAIVDDEKKGERFMRYTVRDPDQLNGIAFDRILITALDSRESAFQRILQNDIAAGAVIEIN